VRTDKTGPARNKILSGHRIRLSSVVGRFSNDWKTGVQKVPTFGKSRRFFSNGWKIIQQFFQ
jgi:hypothetical protein